MMLSMQSSYIDGVKSLLGSRISFLLSWEMGGLFSLVHRRTTLNVVALCS